MQVLMMRLDQLSPYENNPRFNDDAVDKVAESIQEYGFNVPILLDKDNVIVAGHTRYKAAKKLGMEKVPVIRLETLTPEQVKAFRIADNKVGELAEWDMEALKAELKELEKMGFDTSFTGFDKEEIENINDLFFDEKKDVIEDNYEGEIPEEPISQAGDIWILGRHKLICGDSTKVETYQALMEDEKARLIITDPPYNVNYEGSNGLTIKNDSMDSKSFYNFLKDFYRNTYEYTEDGGAIYVFHADSEGVNFRKAFNEAGYKLAQCLIWIKNQFVMGRQDYHWRHEPCLYGWKDTAAHYFIDKRIYDTVIEDKVDLNKMKKEELVEYIKRLKEPMVETSIIREDKPKKNDVHPTMKPLQLIGRLIVNSSKPNWIVMDPFGGSGSTLMTCEQTERICRTIEYDEKYTDVIVNRYIEFRKSDIDVYLIRNGNKIPYSEVIKEHG